jgi:hypothetical protein
VVAGNNIIQAALTPEKPTVAALTFDDSVILGFRLVDHRLLVSMRILDFENRSVLRVRQSRLLHTQNMWDIEYVGTRLKMRHGPRRIWLEIHFNPPDEIDIVRAQIFGHGIGVHVDRQGIVVMNNITWVSPRVSQLRGGCGAGQSVVV